MSNTDAIVSSPTVRKSSREVEIDHLLAEEFSCDPTFVDRFVSACGLSLPPLEVLTAIAEPSLDGEGFGDLLIEASSADEKIALLIEDKITAAPAIRQADRYSAHASRLRERGWNQVVTILVAPSSYRGERNRYDASVDLEVLSTLIELPDLARQSYRRGIIQRALAKKAVSGVQLADDKMHALKATYLTHAAEWMEKRGVQMLMPPLRDRYYDGDSWIDHIKDGALPDHVWLRHRLWTSNQANSGSVDLIISRSSEIDRANIDRLCPHGANVSDFSGAKGGNYILDKASLAP